MLARLEYASLLARYVTYPRFDEAMMHSAHGQQGRDVRFAPVPDRGRLSRDNGKHVRKIDDRRTGLHRLHSLIAQSIQLTFQPAHRDGLFNVIQGGNGGQRHACLGAQRLELVKVQHGGLDLHTFVVLSLHGWVGGWVGGWVVE